MLRTSAAAEKWFAIAIYSISSRTAGAAGGSSAVDTLPVPSAEPVRFVGRLDGEPK
jgi:hypothetical protein